MIQFRIHLGHALGFFAHRMHYSFSMPRPVVFIANVTHMPAASVAMQHSGPFLLETI